MNPRKHAELIKQWAEDSSLQLEFKMYDSGWRDCVNPSWLEHAEYRIKQKQEPAKEGYLVMPRSTHLVSLAEAKYGRIHPEHFMIVHIKEVREQEQ